MTSPADAPKAPAETGLQLPPRVISSLEDNLRRSAASFFQHGEAVTSSVVIASWTQVLGDRPFNAPYFFGLKGRSCIHICFSNRVFSGETALAIVNSGLPLFLRFEAFKRKPYPAVRCHFIFPRSPRGVRDPIMAEGGMDLRDGNFQDFCLAALADEHVDVILGHEDWPDGFCALECSAMGLAGVVRAEVGSAADALDPAATPEDFRATLRAMELAYPDLDSGVDLARCVRLEVTGEARNSVAEYRIRFGES